MANYSNTVKLAALSMLEENANKDFRPAMYGATQAFADFKRDVILNFDDFRNTESEPDLRTRQVDYLRRDTQSVGSARSASLTGAMGDSTRDSLTFVTYTREFTLSDDNLRSNTLGPKMLAGQIKNSVLDLYASIETAAIAKLEAFVNTTQVTNPLVTWDGTNYVSEVALANKTEYFNYIEGDMRNKNYPGMLQLISTPSANTLINYQIAQGTGNSANLQFQFPGFDFYSSNTVSNLSDYLVTSYGVERGALALVDWVPPKNREGLQHGLWDFGVIPDPMGILDAGFAMATYKTVQDSSAGGSNIGGNTQDAVWKFELSIDVAFYIPTITTYKLVHKYGLLSS